MKFVDQLREKAKEAAKKFKKQTSLLAVILDMQHSFDKGVKKIPGTLTFTSKKDIKIKKISYKLVEQLSPLIKEGQANPFVLYSHETKRGFALDRYKEKIIDLDIALDFLGDDLDHQNTDQELLDKVSARARKTSVNYNLEIDVDYTLMDTPKQVLHTKLKHKVGFE